MSEPAEQTLHDDKHGRITLGAKHVALYLPAQQRALSFALHNGGLHDTRILAIHEVKNADLPPEVDAHALLAERMRLRSGDGVGILTSRRISALQITSAEHDGVFARALITAGVSNAVRIGDSPGPLDAWGTINVILQLSAALTDVARIEALSLVAEARTCAVMDAHIPSRRSKLPATGTGTDCIAVVAPEAATAERYAGKHTLLGHLIGDTVRRGLETALEAWKKEYWP